MIDAEFDLLIDECLELLPPDQVLEPAIGSPGHAYLRKRADSGQIIPKLRSGKVG